MQKFAVNFLKENKVIFADFGTTIKEAADKNGICLATPCGGVGVCGACRVRILEGKTVDISQAEKQFLTEQELQAGIRLACKAKIASNLIIENSFIKNEIEILDDILPLETIKKDNDSSCPCLGVAIDLGTTSIVAVVFDTAGKKKIGRVAFANPQASFGSDVMSRVTSVSRDSANLQRMQQMLINLLQTSISGILRSNGRTNKDVKKIVLSGNTIMQHIFVGISPHSMGSAPYKPAFLWHQAINADKIGLPFFDAKIYFMPNISAFVGGDVVAGLAALNFDKKSKKETALFIDLGTNNEMALFANGHIYATSTAAGPAFEGTGISQGISAVEGAICSVFFENGNISSCTIENKQAIGICGSGMIDCLAVLLANNIMEGNGKLNDNSNLVCRNKDGIRQVILTKKDGVCITQKDIRALQLVIASIKAGIKILLKKSGVNEQSLNTIYLAGAFGNFINIENAKKIGLLPYCNATIVSALNTSLLGAVHTLFEDDFLSRAAALARSVITINLAEDEDFQTSFMTCLDFKEP